MNRAKKVISESVEQCISALRGREKSLISALDRDRRLSQEILNRQRERLISKKSALDKVHNHYNQFEIFVFNNS